MMCLALSLEWFRPSDITVRNSCGCLQDKSWTSQDRVAPSLSKPATISSQESLTVSKSPSFQSPSGRTSQNTHTEHVGSSPSLDFPPHEAPASGHDSSSGFPPYQTAAGAANRTTGTSPDLIAALRRWSSVAVRCGGLDAGWNHGTRTALQNDKLSSRSLMLSTLWGNSGLTLASLFQGTEYTQCKPCTRNRCDRLELRCWQPLVLRLAAAGLQFALSRSQYEDIP